MKKITQVRVSEGALVALAHNEGWLTVSQVRKEIGAIRGPTAYRNVQGALDKLLDAGLIRKKQAQSLGRYGTQPAYYAARPILSKMGGRDPSDLVGGTP